MADNGLIIPEYKIKLFNKNKKIINKIENFKEIENIKVKNNNIVKINNYPKKQVSEHLSKKPPKKGLGKTLWVRRKIRR